MDFTAAGLRATSWIFPEPGTEIPFAEIRHVPLSTPEGEVWAFRAVTWREPRQLIRDGYYGTLQLAARACHMHAISLVGGGALSRQDGYGGTTKEPPAGP